MLEPIIWIHRFNEGGGEYSSCCTIVKGYDNMVFIKGLSGNISTKDFCEMRKELIGIGIEEVVYKRKGVWKVLDFKKRGEP